MVRLGLGCKIKVGNREVKALKSHSCIKCCLYEDDECLMKTKMINCKASDIHFVIVARSDLDSAITKASKTKEMLKKAILEHSKAMYSFDRIFADTYITQGHPGVKYTELLQHIGYGPLKIQEAKKFVEIGRLNKKI